MASPLRMGSLIGMKMATWKGGPFFVSLLHIR